MLTPGATLIHVPHAGTIIPSMAGYLVDRPRIQQEIDLLTDWDTDQLFAVPGVEQLVCPWSRVFCDVERFIDNEPMEAVGMGFFYTACDDGTPLREDRDGARDAALRYYQAHHHALRLAVDQRLRQYNSCLLIDAHSFSDIPFQRDHDQSPNRPDICLGTTERNTPDWLVEHAREVFTWAGFSVAINRPYAGSMVPDGLDGDPLLASLMIEVKRSLYVGKGGGEHRVRHAISELATWAARAASAKTGAGMDAGRRIDR
jgi:N-formylglutamate amidohydrolase